MPKAATMPKATVPQRQIETRAKNKTTHPGKVQLEVDSPPPVAKKPRRTKVEIQQEKSAKAQAKEALAEARQQSINRTTEFECADIANEDMVDTTPHPIFTPKPWLLTCKSFLTPLTGDNGVVSDDLDETPFMPGFEGSVAADDSNVESDGPPPPAKKGKAKKTTQKATAARADTKKAGEMADRKRSIVDMQGDVLPPVDSDEEQFPEPKPKKVKVKVRDEINVAAMKPLENEKGGNKYAKIMVNFMGSGGKPASIATVPSHSPQAETASGGRKLKREGAIADLSKFIGGKKLNKEGATAAISVTDKSTTLNLPDSTTRADPDNNIR